MAAIKLGELLVKAKVLTEPQLKAALTEQEKWGGKLGEILVRMNAMSEDMLVKALSKQTGIASVNLDAIDSIAPHVKSRIPAQLARDLTALPLQLRDEGRTLIVAMSDPTHLPHLDTLRKVSRCRIQVQLAGRSAIARAYGRFYEGESDLAEVPDGESMKMLDTQGNSVVKSHDAVVAEHLAKKGPKSPTTRAIEEARAANAKDAGPSAGGAEALITVKGLEDVQKKEIAVLRSMVELLIEKGIFTREEYLAKVKR